jgi:hypothetical protein
LLDEGLPVACVFLLLLDNFFAVCCGFFLFSFGGSVLAWQNADVRNLHDAAASSRVEMTSRSDPLAV